MGRPGTDPAGGRAGGAHPSKSGSTGKSRRRWGSISRRQIVDAALGAIEKDGFDSLTIRSLSAELGVAPMSLYRHVRDKDDLLDEVADRLLEAARPPRASGDDWQGWVVDAADRLRALLVAQPAVLHVFLGHPVVSPTAVDRMEAFREVFCKAGLDERESRNAYAAVQTYTIGFAALEASRIGWQPPTDATDPVMIELAAYATPRQFGEGLRYMLEGIAGHRQPTGSGRPSSRPDATGSRPGQSGS